MISSPLNDLYFSLCLYVDHQILQKGHAFTNVSSQFYNVQDPELPGLSVYASPYKQPVGDFSISGANVPTGVYANNVFCLKNNSGMMYDYVNNRVYFSGGYNNLTVSGSYSVKNFNVYPTSKSDEELIYETAFQLNPSYVKSLSGLSKYDLTVPGIFITNNNFQNETYSFGGLVESVINVHCIILADSKDQLDAVGCLLTDEKYSSFPVIDAAHIPFNYYGDYRTGLGNYNYLSYVAQFLNNLAYIADADFYKLSNRDFSNRYPDLRAAFCDFQIKYVRLPNRSVF